MHFFESRALTSGGMRSVGGGHPGQRCHPRGHASHTVVTTQLQTGTLLERSEHFCLFLAERSLSMTSQGAVAVRASSHSTPHTT